MIESIDAAAFQATLDALTQAIAVVPDDSEAKGFANRAACDLLGLATQILTSCELGAEIERLARRSTREEGPEFEKLPADSPVGGDSALWHVPGEDRYLRVRVDCLGTERPSARVWIFDDVTDAVLAQKELAATEAHLRASEHRYQLIAENASDIVLAADNDRVITWIAPSVTTTFGWDTDEVTGMELAAFVHPDDLPRMAKLSVLVFNVDEEGAGPVGSLVRCRTAEGHYRWMLGRAGPVFDSAGDQAGIVIGLRSVEDLVASRDESEQARQLLQATMDGMLTPLVLWQAIRDEDAVVRDFVMVDANRATSEYLQTDRSVLVGATMRQVFPQLAESSLIPAMVNCLETGESLRLEDFFYHNELLGDDRWYNVEGSKVLDGVALSWHDVTERHLSRVQLAESEAHYRELSQRTEELRSQLDALLTDGSVLALRLSPEGEVHWISGSSTQLLGVTPENIVGSLGGPMVHPDDVGEVGVTLNGVLRTGKPDSLTLRIRHADGGYRVFEGTLFRADETTLQATLTDITEREEADQLRQLVVAVASHELRTPLAFLYATLSMMQDGTVPMDSPTGQDLLDRMVASAARLGRLADSLLRMQRLQAAGGGEELEPLAVGASVAEAARSVDMARGIEVDVRDETKGRKLLINADLLTQAVVNLVGNAVKFSPNDARVEVSVSCIGDRVQVTVRDHGRGIPPDHLPNVFDSFYQVRADDRLHGIGLGLPIVRRIAELHQGRVRVFAPSDGEGSIFVLEMRERPFVAPVDDREQPLVVLDGAG